MANFSFKRGERLKSSKVIEHLFKGGQSFAQFPLRVVWKEMPGKQSEYPVQFALSVSKKKFKRAVDRNRIRRLVREAYRLNKHILYEALENSHLPIVKSRQSSAPENQQLAISHELPATNPQQIALMIIYTGSEILPFIEVEKTMRSLLLRFIKKYQAGNQK